LEWRRRRPVMQAGAPASGACPSRPGQGARPQQAGAPGPLPRLRRAAGVPARSPGTPRRGGAPGRVVSGRPRAPMAARARGAAGVAAQRGGRLAAGRPGAGGARRLGARRGLGAQPGPAGQHARERRPGRARVHLGGAAGRWLGAHAAAGLPGAATLPQPYDPAASRLRSAAQRSAARAEPPRLAQPARASRSAALCLCRVLSLD
jgi:hypothetical protein